MSSTNHDAIFRDFSAPQRGVFSAPAGNGASAAPARSTPQLPAAAAAAAAASDYAADYAASSAAERSRHADAFSAEQRSTMARFASDARAAVPAAASSAASPPRNTAMGILLTRDRSKTSALVAELRREAHFMKKAEERIRSRAAQQQQQQQTQSQSQEQTTPLSAAAAASAEAAAADACLGDSDGGNGGSPLGGAMHDAEEMGRFAALAARSASHEQRIAEMQQEQTELAQALLAADDAALLAEQKAAADAARALEEEQEHARRQQQAAAEDDDEEIGRASAAAALWRPERLAAPPAAADGGEQQKSADAAAKKKVVFSHLPTGSPKMSYGDAAVRLQRSMRRYIAAGAAQRTSGLERMLAAWEAAHRGKASKDVPPCPLFCGLPAGSACTCCSTARWLQCSGSGSASNATMISCRTAIFDAPYALQCLAAASIEFETRLHGENLSQWYIHDGAHGSSHGRGTNEVPRLSAEEKQLLRSRGQAPSSSSPSSSDDDDDHGEDADASVGDASALRAERRRAKLLPTLPEQFRVLRKASLPQEEVDELLNMLETALAAERFAVTDKRSSSSSNRSAIGDAKAESAGEVDKENTAGGSEDKKKTAATTNPRAEAEDNNESGGGASPSTSSPTSVLELAAQWVHSQLEPFAALSFCAILGGSAAHAASLERMIAQHEAASSGTKKRSSASASAAAVAAARVASPLRGKLTMLECYSLGALAPAPSFFDKQQHGGRLQAEQEEAAGSGAAASLLLLQQGSAGRGYEAARATVEAEANERRRTIGSSGFRQPIAPRIFFISAPPAATTTDASGKTLPAATDTVTLRQVPVSVSVEQERAYDEREAAAKRNKKQQPQPQQNAAVAVGFADDADEQLPPCPPLTEDEKALLREMGDDDPLLGEALRQIAEADDEEYRASVADMERRLAVVSAVHKQAQREQRRATGQMVSCGTGAETEEEIAQEKAMLALPSEAIRGSVLVKPTTSTSASAAAAADATASRLCVICELDEIGTTACRCGNFFHRECGVPRSKTATATAASAIAGAAAAAQMKCCSACDK